MTETKNKNIIHFLLPPPNWRFSVIVVLGILVGLVIHLLNISNAVSYLSDDPKTCVNCHVMYPEFATWEKGSHGRVTNCNDCHVPQDNVIRKYLFKASDGLRHASMFTFRMEPQVIRIKDAGREVVQENCIRCHANFLHPVALRAIGAKSIHEDSDRVCWDCHRETPHGKVHSLSSAPNMIKPNVKTVVPNWIKSNKLEN
jgi:cytochrome c nitrite reductase small subunit